MMHRGRDWERICKSRDIGSEPVRFTLRDNTDLVLVRDRSGQILAMSNRCPHKDASLHRSGDIEDMGGELGLCLRCPKHRGKFGGGLYVSFATGKCTTHTPCSTSDRVARWEVPVFDVKEEDGAVSVRPRTGATPPPAEITPVVAPQPAPPRAVERKAEEPRLAAQLEQARQVSPDSFVFTLSLLDRADCAAFAREPAAMWHVWLHLGDVSREYTPVSGAAHTARTGEVQLLIKLYPDGIMSRALGAARAGDRVAISPPRTTLQIPALEGTAASMEETSGGRFNLLAGGTGILINLLAGGTGIAPCLQLARRALDAAATVRLVYSVRTHEDMLVADELAALAQSGGGGFRYAVVFSQDERPMDSLVERTQTAFAGVYGRRVDMATVQEHLLGMAEAGRVLRTPHTADMTVISGPNGFNEHCESLVRRLVSAQEHTVAVLDA